MSVLAALVAESTPAARATESGASWAACPRTGSRSNVGPPAAGRLPELDLAARAALAVAPGGDGAVVRRDRRSRWRCPTVGCWPCTGQIDRVTSARAVGGHRLQDGAGPVRAGRSRTRSLGGTAGCSSRSTASPPAATSTWRTRRSWPSTGTLRPPDGRRRCPPASTRRGPGWSAWLRSLAAIVDAIAAGLFVPHPDEPDPWRRARCPYCDPDGADTATLWGQRQHKRGDTVLDAYRPWCGDRRRVGDEALAADDRSTLTRSTMTGRAVSDAPASPTKDAAAASPATSDPPCSCRPAPAPARPTNSSPGRGPGERREQRSNRSPPSPSRRRRPTSCASGSGSPSSSQAATTTATAWCRSAAVPRSDDLDQAALCTLHAFAQRILTAYPVEAGLPPALSVLDEIASELDFDQRFRSFYSELVGRPELERTVVLASGARHHRRAAAHVAEQPRRQLDLVRVPTTGPEPPAARPDPCADRRPGPAGLLRALGLG